MQCENKPSPTDCLYPSSCQFPSGPCPSVIARQYNNGRCKGVTPYATPTPAPAGRNSFHRALSISVEAMKNMVGVNTTPEQRLEIFVATLENIRCHVGDARLTSMALVCCVCGDHFGTKEGNGATGPTGAHCPKCSTHLVSATLGKIAGDAGAKIDPAKEWDDMNEVAFRKVHAAICDTEFIAADADERQSAIAKYPGYAYYAAILTGIRNTIRESDDKRDAAAIENAALI